MELTDLFPHLPAVIGMVHLHALPGSPGFNGDMDKIIQHALQDARALSKGGVDGIIVENFWDAPFPKMNSDPVTISAITVCVQEIIREIKVPVGVNVLRNDALAALSIAEITGASFIRVNVLTHAMVTDQGIIEGCSYRLSRLQKQLNSKIKIFADIMVKHAYPLAPMDLETLAKDAVSRGGADVLIVSGTGTGEPINMDDARRIKQAAPRTPLASGSGIDTDNISKLAEFIDLFIVGTFFKKEGKVEEEIESERVSELIAAVR
jgi:membrane complex biogenesis BtpA family protein